MVDAWPKRVDPADDLVAWDQRQPWVRQFAIEKPTRYGSSPIWANQFLAMANARLGKTDEAQANLNEAGRLEKEIDPECWVDALTRKLLNEEAQAAIDNSHKHSD